MHNDINLLPKNQESIKVVLCCNNNYISYITVCIQSIFQNRNLNKIYELYLLIEDISDQNKLTLIEMFNIPNFSLDIIDIGPLMKEYDSSIFTTTLHFTVATYYRMFIPRIFKNFDKILYLDGDTIVLSDLVEIYDTEMDDYPISGCKDLVVIGNQIEQQYNIEILKLKKPKEYLQAGVILFNIPKILGTDFEKKFIEKLKELGVPRYVDQDVINCIYHDQIFWQDLSWDTCWHLPIYDQLKFLEKNDLESYLKSYNYPKIIHYTSNLKPWTCPEYRHADKWWHYARQTPFYEEILFKNIQHKNNEKLEMMKQNFQEKIDSVQNQINSINIFEILKNIKKKKKKYLKYKILSKILFGKIRQKYKMKRKQLKEEIKNIKII